MTTADKVKGYTIAAIFVIFFIISTYTTYFVLFQRNFGMAVLITVISSFFGHTLVVVSIILANCSHREYYRKFFLQIQEISTKTIFYPKRLYRKLLCYFVVISMIGLFLVVVDIMLHSFVSDFGFIMVYFNTHLTHILLLPIYLQILYKVEFLLCYFQILNDKFANILVFKIPHDQGTQNNISGYVRELCKIHRQLCNLIQNTNGAHGWQIILLFCTIAVFSLSTLYFGVIYPVSEYMKTPKTSSVIVFKNLKMIEGIFSVLFHCVRSI